MEWYQILSLIICIEGFLNVAFIIITLNEGFDSAFGVYIPMPKNIKNNTEMNWFGCIVCYILLFILFPIQNIGKIIYWSFHIKKDKSE